MNLKTALPSTPPNVHDWTRIYIRCIIHPNDTMGPTTPGVRAFYPYNPQVTDQTLTTHTAINQFFTIWSHAIEYISKNNSAIIIDAAVPTLGTIAGTIFSIDTILKNLITLYSKIQPRNARNDALGRLLEDFHPRELYTQKIFDGENGELGSLLNPDVELLLQKRLAELLKHVQSDLEAFVTMAAVGVFTMPPVPDMDRSMETGIYLQGLI
ncbi:MAG: hypothetical protein Q9226_006248, partial [Calogaya cf. arnoldii]